MKTISGEEILKRLTKETNKSFAYHSPNFQIFLETYFKGKILVDEAELQEKIKRVESDHFLLNTEDDIYVFPEEKILVVRSKGENHYYINTEEILKE